LVSARTLRVLWGGGTRGDGLQALTVLPLPQATRHLLTYTKAHPPCPKEKPQVAGLKKGGTNNFLSMGVRIKRKAGKKIVKEQQKENLLWTSRST